MRRFWKNNSNSTKNLTIRLSEIIEFLETIESPPA
jgi:hypothetical protein